MSADGRDCELPAGGGRHQTTVLRRHHEPVAALVHDPSLSEEADLLAAVSSATLLALENERLWAQVQAQLEEVTASRARIVEASQAERRRPVAVTVTSPRWPTGPDLRVEIADDGTGGAEPTPGSGLRSLADRVAALGGTFAIDSPRGGGTRVSVTLPCA